MNDLSSSLQWEKEKNKTYFTYFYRGCAFFGLGNHRSALADLNRAIREAPTGGMFYLVRSRVYEQMGQVDYAQTDLLEALRRDAILEDESLRATILAFL